MPMLFHGRLDKFLQLLVVDVFGRPFRDLIPRKILTKFHGGTTKRMLGAEMRKKTSQTPTKEPPRSSDIRIGLKDEKRNVHGKMSSHYDLHVDLQG